MKNKKEQVALKIIISDSSSELVMRMEEIIKNDITSQKLPIKIKNTGKSSNDN